jgi:hypothetical protein
MRLGPRRALVIIVSAALAASVAAIELTDKTTSATDPGKTDAVVHRHGGDDITSMTPTTPTAAVTTSPPTRAAKPKARKHLAKATSSATPAAAKSTKRRPSVTGGTALLGMSAPLQFWNERVSEVGPGLQARRLFFTSFDASISKAQDSCNAGMYPVMSFKTGSYSWAQVAAGNADAALQALHTRLAALTCNSFVAVHHEPSKDGAAADWAAMQVHALPILGGAAGGKIKVGVIGNGWWWSATKKGFSDGEIAAYITPGVKAVSDVIAGDTYQMTATGEDAATKIRRMAAWAHRVGGVKALGVGEFNAPTAASISSALKALAADPMFAWGCLWNADLNTVSVLSGARLTAFRTALANW